MSNRDFSDSVKLAAITDNLRLNNGEICCAVCGKKLLSIQECHFDHIFPFAKGGNSSLDNCQILCVSCNLKKNDKEMNDFLLEEKAKQFFAGKTETISNHIDEPQTTFDSSQNSMTKELFDQSISDFIARKGNINKVDFSREYNHLPSIHYMKKYYGDLNSLKKAFGIEDLSANWNRETIKTALDQYVEQHGDLLQKDLTKENNLPSIPCILNYYPEYRCFTDIKQKMYGLHIRNKWDKETVIQAGKEYVQKHGKITESSLRSENNLPSTQIIYRYFGSLTDYQEAVGSEISQRNEFISERDIEIAINRYFGTEERKVESQKVFFSTFPYSPSTILKRFGSFSSFCNKYGIIVAKTKKAKYSRQEVDDAIAKWVKNNKGIPRSKELSRFGLPSMSVIMKYYENWKEPFIFYQKLYDKFQ